MIGEQLDRVITLQLQPLANGKAGVSDFNDSTLLYTFSIGARSGDFECGTISIANDIVVEDTEDFVVELHDPLDISDVEITSSSAKVFIFDSSFESTYVDGILEG